VGEIVGGIFPVSDIGFALAQASREIPGENEQPGTFWPDVASEDDRDCPVTKGDPLGSGQSKLVIY
jgi:hypothetical protein